MDEGFSVLKQKSWHAYYGVFILWLGIFRHSIWTDAIGIRSVTDHDHTLLNLSYLLTLSLEGGLRHIEATMKLCHWLPCIIKSWTR